MPNADRPGRVVLLNGTSSAGKTTLARAIQDESGTPFVHWGIDTLFGLVPPNRGGGRDGPLSRDGFWYDRTGSDADGRPSVVIHCGGFGRRVLRSAQLAAAAFARGGDDLVVDELLPAPDLLSGWAAALSGLEVLLVSVTCPLAVAERRERERSNPVGPARGHFGAVHDHGVPYDLTVDTTSGTPAEPARTVLAALDRSTRTGIPV
ncbi:chloramphenicol phosphotransferase [Saccharothrix sp. BKS2]|uniref:chloramphenicol phosphotransferase CPT family protein n=1 Tax=Saccharothrix sp. BKS2 TaxID=3064400 RepID=UPI0039EB5DB5